MAPKPESSPPCLHTLTAPAIVSTSMHRSAGIAALVIAFLVGACSDTASSAPAAQTHPSPFPFGMTLTCTDRYQSFGRWGLLKTGDTFTMFVRTGKSPVGGLTTTAPRSTLHQVRKD